MMNERLDIDRIAFIGRTLKEYRDIFALGDDLLRRGPVLDCPAGAASFAAEANAAGFDVTACDILFGLGPAQLARKAEGDLRHVIEKFDAASHQYTWTYYRDKGDLVAHRRRALDAFLADYPGGKAEGRYVEAALPRLPFPDGRFTLVVSSHFLFLYGDRMCLDFHLAALAELVRVARDEVRIFPLQGLDARPYPPMDEVMAFLGRASLRAELLGAPFEFQKGSNTVLRILKEER